jgi:hypothetical protein
MRHWVFDFRRFGTTHWSSSSSIDGQIRCCALGTRKQNVPPRRHILELISHPHRCENPKKFSGCDVKYSGAKVNGKGGEFADTTNGIFSDMN